MGFDAPMVQLSDHLLGAKEAASQSTSSSTIDFFGLPATARDRIYEIVLAIRHPIYLFEDSSSRVETFAPDRPLH